ncbi:FAD-dependent oxidoreductase [Hymenobacter metallicola]|uniref:FAD-dependent oxidoreductase n=1 Tax=Hymenobacter metallicola TaxID=2563114 RepID=A0A4Z0QJ73_9BACT|nr:FAD-dependent oxidoreductase [Hymenobacter metallicola]TGE29556.1 FAD-dependent oxidoreductase [Hymenobacter metallicola]
MSVPDFPQCPFLPGRREFLGRAGLGMAGLLLGPGLLESCAPGSPRAHIRGTLRGANKVTGHQLWNPGQLPAPTHTVQTDIVIIGGGVAGLSAKRWLHRHGQQNVLLLELDAHVGGNSASGQNATSAFPWGAHYLPLPDPRHAELLEFLRETGTITGTAPDGRPIYNEYHLCHDPEERLHLHGHWQTGLVPELGVPASDRAQIARFFELIETLRHARGQDGLDAFRIPVDQSSQDEQFRRLDAISFADYLTQHGFTSDYLRWYLDYCCKDDYGTTAAMTSAWAGLHYFAARKGDAHNASSADVLTWPQGNGFLVEHLRRQAPEGILPNTLAYAVQETATGVAVLTYNTLTQKTSRLQARHVLLATPQFVTQRLLHGLPGLFRPTQPLHRAPWVVANLTVDGLPQGPGAPLSWDNVIYGAESVGYVNANQQDVALGTQQKVITYYWPLTDELPKAARQRAYRTSYDQWLTQILAELEKAHVGITARVRHADVWVWGHGMVAPTPGTLWHPGRQQAAQPLRQRFFFAHTDLSGMSIFEEGFYQGIRAARQLLGHSA